MKVRLGRPASEWSKLGLLGAGLLLTGGILTIVAVASGHTIYLTVAIPFIVAGTVGVFFMKPPSTDDEGWRRRP